MSMRILMVDDRGVTIVSYLVELHRDKVKLPNVWVIFLSNIQTRASKNEYDDEDSESEDEQLVCNMTECV